ncbi:hypothetical protein DE146DRAFT_666141 [Phaeosphaeria sp. MPI-PUGE-AT-0046c]|nr:hypothetical protein DE146DRAFT_666141 [Phaeosphaeria sp. MPI-PUGE-AT-0046c]
MAEPINLDSGLLAIVIFTHKSCLTLHSTLQSFKTHPKRVRDFVQQLETLLDALESLTDTVKTNTDVNLSVLDLPLQRCGNACNEFMEELQKCYSRSGDDKQSFRDWAKLKYMGDNIDDFKNSLAAYQSTITIALMEIKTRKSSVTLKSLKEYKDMVKTATNDLEARLETVDERLEALMVRTVVESESPDLKRIKDERTSTKKCLLVCAQFSKLIDELQPTLTNSMSRDDETIPGQITSDGLRECRVSIDHTVERLEKHMQDILGQIMSKSDGTMTQEDRKYLGRLREEWETARQCRDICNKADQHLKNDISVIDNHATGDDAVQFLVSNSQKTIHGKNRGFGDHIKQLGGHLSDASIQKLFGDFSQISIRRFESDVSLARGEALVKGKGVNKEKTNWHPQYGSGRLLNSELHPHVAASHESSSGSELDRS